jgi:hypothetical protein
MFNINQTKYQIMDFKKSIVNLLICLVLSPIVIYIILGLAKLAGSTYEMSNGETFIIWLLMAIVIKLSLVQKA